ncbi:helix-turn-helix domain containing protein [Mycobacterium sp. CVI_P3]|uniref:Helix-turn-helix domain containing protein n=1 Tax=Mycobacterium pinniadriaticum TaxID=2994102 RepID=A0ABT3S910_9MYCO|nr:TetR/AcrR family transcriptional regulator [Mycobacterium pinniadriaticum]MCX2929569.1 helix-turn-helix domain containing protein [Mycobacterium pinniadriaticum]MCX2935993.1 helix-turn-helix domain containing protein [Mycobacterium pinniadriaticum]
MGTVAVVATTPDTRQRLIDAAIALFIRHSYAGTSLQMIADELGFTKAAIYHHFRTREQLLTAILEPIIDKLTAVVDEAERKRGVHARAEYMLSGYARLAVENPMLVSVLASDPSVHTVLKANREWAHMISRQMALLADVHPGPEGFIRAQFVFAGIAGSADPRRDADEEWLHGQLVDAGRRALGLRTPRRTP